MSHGLGTFCAVSDAAADGPTRWRLERAGIINVYQYGNEVLDFAGGRLLLRGVNGSGKSTAMNMLLPFLLTANPRNIDAAQEQSRLLHSWMLAGREDAQPVGYLWIEFRCFDEFFACGCGIRANRQSDRVTTWWFATSKRPCIDFELVAARVPLSAEHLRERLGEGAVFREADRPAYRALVARTLFGGAPLDQHLRLIDKVRNPRVGDRVDLDLPRDLVDALPQLSDKALADAAAPLDDLDEHRRNMAELERTVSALGALFDRYRRYCLSDLRERAEEARLLLSKVRRGRRDAARLCTQAAETERELHRLTEHIASEERRAELLRSEVSAIVESSAYQEGRQLDGVRDLVERLRRTVTDAGQMLDTVAKRVDDLSGEVASAQRRSEGHLERVNRSLSEAAQLAGRCGLAARPVSGLSVRHRSIDGADAAMPEAVELTESVRDIDQTSAAIQQRRRDIAAVDEAHALLGDAEAKLGQTQGVRDAALEAHRQAAEQHESAQRLLAEAHEAWRSSVRQWADEAEPLCFVADDTATTRDLSLPQSLSRDVRSELRCTLLAALEAAVARQHDTTAATSHLHSEAHAAVVEQQSALDDLMNRSAPEPPRLDWQSPDGYCLADVVDFADGLTPDEQAGLEAALEASGLLEARPVGNDRFELATGELVAVASRRADRPLSLVLDVVVPPYLVGQVHEGAVAGLLDSVQCDGSAVAQSDAREQTGEVSVAAVSTDGTFAVGSLRGRHNKQQAEHIGVAAQRDALERARTAARRELDRLRAEAARLEELHGEQRELLDSMRAHRDAFPPSSALDDAERTADMANAAREQADERRQAAEADLAESERAAAEADADLHRVAARHSLPRARAALREIGESLTELGHCLTAGKERATTLEQGVHHWGRIAAQLSDALGERTAAQERLRSATAEFDRERARLERLTASLGATYERLRRERDRLEAERRAVEEGLPATRGERDAVTGALAGTRAEAEIAERSVVAAEADCDAFRRSLDEVLAAPGYLAALADGDLPETPSAAEAGSAGLRDVLAAMEQIAAAHEAERQASRAGSAPDADSAQEAETASGASDVAPADGSADDDASWGVTAVTAQSVRDSLRQRRDALGGGWDAVDIQPDASLPLRIEVSGPRVGNATLPDAYASAASKLATTAGLLDRKQRDALRELLQGLIATEIAQKMHAASERIELMNRRLGKVATAHRVGVRLRWRRSPDLDPAESRTVELLAKPPDVRTAEETAEVRSALADRLAQARADEPDASYRQLIARTLDYRTWHELDVMIRRPEAPESRLSRRTPLSEGEKKLVTYLPLFAAVAASYDAMAGAAADPHIEPPGIERFVLLDDAFAKVSADNHDALFGLLVELDLDFIATSERLWGDHASVPELSIVEIVRDPSLRTILLDRYSWHGRDKEQAEAA